MIPHVPLRRLPALLGQGCAFVSCTCDHLGTDGFRIEALGRRAAHHHRKAMFRTLLNSANAGTITEVLAEDFARAAGSWAGQDRVQLHTQAELLLTGTALRWAGVPLAGTSVWHRARELSAMVDWIGMLGVRPVR